MASFMFIRIFHSGYFDYRGAFQDLFCSNRLTLKCNGYFTSKAKLNITRVHSTFNAECVDSPVNIIICKKISVQIKLEIFKKSRDHSRVIKKY